MFPGVSGFQWDAGHLIFLGAFFTVVALIAGTVITAAVRSLIDFRMKNDGHILWEADFEDLPVSARHCRHEFTGEFRQRVCERGFECGGCREHEKLVSMHGDSAAGATAEELVFGFSMPSDRLYHRGHTWVRPEDDGTVTVGMDDFGRRLTGEPDGIDLPPVGTLLHANGTAWLVRKNGSTLKIRAPLEGVVVATAGSGQGWHLRLKPVADRFDLRPLLRGREIKPWVMREMERLQRALSSDGIGISLADGGTPVEDFPRGYPGTSWDAVWGDMFLEP